MATTKPAFPNLPLLGSGKTLTNSDTIRNAILNMNSSSSTYGIVAAGTTQGTATQLNSVLNQVDTVAANTGVNLPLSTGKHNSPYQWVVIINNGVNNLSVYGAQGSTDTINGVAGSTAAVILPGATSLFNSAKGGAWFSGDTGNAQPAVTPIPAGSTLTVTPAMNNGVILLNAAAGSTVTLPAATGTGNKYQFRVTTTATSNAHKILAASVSDFLNGNAIGHTAAGATLAFSAAAATAHSIQMPFAGTQPSGGFIGDYFNFVDVGTNLWAVDGMYQAGTTATTPFSSATT